MAPEMELRWVGGMAFEWVERMGCKMAIEMVVQSDWLWVIILAELLGSAMAVLMERYVVSESAVWKVAMLVSEQVACLERE